LPDKQAISRPLHGSGESNLDGKHGVLVGGASSARTRPIQEEWVLPTRDQCEKANVSFFFKQWEGVRKCKAGRDLEGKKDDRLPDAANCRCWTTPDAWRRWQPSVA
jgi:protein gp37